MCITYLNSVKRSVKMLILLIEKSGGGIAKAYRTHTTKPLGDRAGVFRKIRHLLGIRV